MCYLVSEVDTDSSRKPDVHPDSFLDLLLITSRKYRNRLSEKETVRSRVMFLFLEKANMASEAGSLSVLWRSFRLLSAELLTL